MSSPVILTVQCQVSEPEGLKDLARKHESLVRRHDRRSTGYDGDAIRFLEDVGEGRCVYGASKGYMLTWGIVGNYSSPVHFVDALKPFFADLYRERVVWHFSGIVVMAQHDQQGQMVVYEIENDATVPRTKDKDGEITLVIRARVSHFPIFESFYERPEGLLPEGIRTDTWVSRKGS